MLQSTQPFRPLISLEPREPALRPLIDAALNYWRTPESEPALLDGLLLYYLEWRAQRRIKPDTLPLRRLVSLTLLESAIAELRQIDRNAATILTAYYEDGRSDEQILIKYRSENPEYFSSRPVVYRRRGEAIGQLTHILAVREREARQSHVARLLSAMLTVPPPFRLFGRADAQARLTALLTAENRPVLFLSGLGGLGKSVLAAVGCAALLKALTFWHIFWVNLPAEADRMAATKTSALWEYLVGRLYQQFAIMPQEQADLAQQEAQLRLAFDYAPHLVVIDDLDDPAQTAAIAPRLADLAGRSKFLLIGRAEPAVELISAVHTLAELSPDDSVALLRQRAADLQIDALRAPDDALVQQIQTLVGGHPQALTLLLQLARHRQLDSLLSAFAAANMTRVEELYDMIYAALWQLVDDQAKARALLMALTLVTRSGGEPDYLCALANLDEAAFWTAALDLAQLSFLVKDDRVTPWRYSIHQLTHTYLRHRQPASDDELAAALLAGCRYWQRALTLDDPARRLTAANLSAHYDNIAQLLYTAFNRPATWAAAVACCGDLFMTVENSPFWREWLLLCDYGLNCAPANAGTRERLRLMRMLGWLYRVDNRHQDAIAILEQAIALARATGQVDLMGECLVYISIAERHLHHFEQANAAADDALDIFDELRATHPAWLAAANNAKGLNNFHAGNFVAALPYYEAAARHYMEAGHTSGVIRAHNNRGNALKELDRLAEAKAELTTALAQAQTTRGTSDRDLVTTSLLDLALYSAEALALAELQAYAAARLQATDTTLYHRALLAMGLGQLARRAANLTEATEWLETACALWREQPELPLRAVALAELGLCYEATNLTNQAAECLTEAATLVASEADTNRLFATALTRIAELEQALGQAQQEGLHP